MIRPLLLALCALSLNASVSGWEIVVQNDVGALGNPAYASMKNTRVGAVLTMPKDGTIVGVQIMWGSVLGTAPPMQQQAISFSTDGVNDTPGAPLAQILNPTLVDGGTNVFRYLDPGTNSLPLSVPVLAGQEILIDLTLLPAISPSEGPGVPGILSDANMVPGRNLFTVPPLVPFWGDLQVGFGGGDLAIRAIFEPVPEPSSWVLAFVALTAVGGVTVCARKRC